MHFNTIMTPTTWSNCTLWKSCPCIYVHVSSLIILYTNLCAYYISDYSVRPPMCMFHLWLYYTHIYVHVSSIIILYKNLCAYYISDYSVRPPMCMFYLCLNRQIKKNGIRGLHWNLSNFVLLCTGSVHVSKSIYIIFSEMLLHTFITTMHKIQFH